jgi:hypothetical protein
MLEGGTGRGVKAFAASLYTVMPRLNLLYVKPPRIRIGGTEISILRVGAA